MQADDGTQHGHEVHPEREGYELLAVAARLEAEAAAAVAPLRRQASLLRARVPPSRPSTRQPP